MKIDINKPPHALPCTQQITGAGGEERQHNRQLGDQHLPVYHITIVK